MKFTSMESLGLDWCSWHWLPFHTRNRLVLTCLQNTSASSVKYNLHTLTIKTIKFSHVNWVLYFFHLQGNISRQEAVSMIPPLLLDIKPGQKVMTLNEFITYQIRRLTKAIRLVFCGSNYPKGQPAGKSIFIASYYTIII